MVMSSHVWQRIELGLLGLVAALLVFGVRLAVQAAAVHAPAVDDGPPPTPAAAVQPLDAYAVIEQRNIFGTAPDAAAPKPAILLRGVGVHAGAARAAIEDTGTHEQRLVAVGDSIGDGRVAAIAWDHLTIARPGGDLTVRLAPSADEPPPVEPAATGTTPTPPASGIRRTGANAFIVDRRALASALDSASGLMSQVRAVAEIEDGRTTGFRVFQVADESLFAALGLASGDVVQRVNGKPVTDPAALLGFLKQLRTEPRVALDVVHAGAARTMVYDLR